MPLLKIHFGSLVREGLVTHIRSVKAQRLKFTPPGCFATTRPRSTQNADYGRNIRDPLPAEFREGSVWFTKVLPLLAGGDQEGGQAVKIKNQRLS
jgi:hypothetical protein